MSTATTDIADAQPSAQVCQPIFRDFGGALCFNGPIRTLKLFEDNSLVRTALQGDGGGAVLVIDGGGSNRCALVGGNLAALAAANNWAGLVVYGHVRDADELAAAAVGIKALGTHPKKSEKRNSGQADLALQFAGVHFTPGAWLYADRDGVVITMDKAH